MHPKDKAQANELKKRLREYSVSVTPLPGIEGEAECDTLIEQFFESIRRINFIAAIKTRDISSTRADPTSDNFDPIRASLWHARQGHMDEAMWLAFLSVQFGRHVIDKWRLTKDIYGAMGSGKAWTWNQIIANPPAFTKWLVANYPSMKTDGISRRFGNHRQYESLKVSVNNRGTGPAIESYVEWVGRNRGHEQMIQEAIAEVGNDPHALFDYLYKNMDVVSFARLGKFDYLTMLGKLGYAPIEPGKPYLVGASGPLRGARLIFGDKTSAETIMDQKVVELGNYLGLGMQVMEDSLCNWQKSPATFIAFRG